MSVDTHSTTTPRTTGTPGPITGPVPLPTTFRDASRPVTTFQRAVLDSPGERVDLAPDIMSRYMPGPPAVVEVRRRRRRVSSTRRLR